MSASSLRVAVAIILAASLATAPAAAASTPFWKMARPSPRSGTEPRARRRAQSGWWNG